MNVLIADDDILSQSLFEWYMCKLGWEYVIVSDGNQVVKACLSGSFDAILMDINMPELDGIEATKQIRKFNSSIPIIAISAIADSEKVNECTQSGMNTLIELPTSYDVIRDVITRCVEKG